MEEANLSRIRENIELTERIIKERFEDAEDSQFIEKILRRELKDPQLVVDEVVMDYGSEKGGNFLSMLKRATVTGKWKFGADNKGASHRGFRQSLIIKRALLSDSQEDVFFGREAFENEVAAYSIIVPIFQKMCLAREQLVPYPKCLFSGDDDRGNPMIVLEDLRELGFETAKRSLTFEECDLVVRKFANLHAISMVLRIVNRREFDQCLAVINDYMYVSGRESKKTIFPSVFEFNLNGGLRSLKAHNEDGRLTKSIHFLERHLTNNQLYEVIARIVTREADENLLAICHGDSWCNNIMLRTELCDARIIDLQIMRYASPTIDLLHCIYSSMDVHSLNQYYPQLIANYQATLMATIATIAKPYFSLEGISDQIEHLKSLHTTELILERMRRDSLYGFGMLLILLPVLPGVAMGSCFTSKSQDGWDICPGSSYCSRLRDTVLAFEAMGVFQEEFL